MKQASKLANPVVRRAGFSTDKYKIVDVRMIPANQEYDPETGECSEVDRGCEMLEVCARNPRHEPVEFEISLEELLKYITPELFEDVKVVEPEEETEEDEDLEPLEEETEPVKPKTVRKKRSNTGDAVYDEWVDNLFEWKKRKVAKARARRKQ